MAYKKLEQKPKKDLIVGITILLISLPLYIFSFPVFIFGGIFGLTSDNPFSNQSQMEHLLVRFTAFLLLASNISLSFAGIQIFRGRFSKKILLLILFGLFALYVFLQNFHQ